MQIANLHLEAFLHTHTHTLLPWDVLSLLTVKSDVSSWSLSSCNHLLLSHLRGWPTLRDKQGNASLICGIYVSQLMSLLLKWKLAYGCWAPYTHPNRHETHWKHTLFHSSPKVHMISVKLQFWQTSHNPRCHFYISLLASLVSSPSVQSLSLSPSALSPLNSHFSFTPSHLSLSLSFFSPQ